MTNKLFYICVLITTTVLIFCSTSMENKKSELIKMLDSAGEIYVPDTRLGIWDYQISDTSNILQLKLESDQKKGLDYVKDKLNNDFPEVKYDLLLLPDPALKGKTFGLINISTSNMRKFPKHSAELVNQELMGTPVRVFKKEEGWYLIQAPNGYVGWIDAPAMNSRTQEQMEKLSDGLHIIFTKPYGQIFKNIQKTEPVSDIVLGNILEVIDNKGGFYEVRLPDGRTGFVEKEGFNDFKSISYKSKIDTSQMISFAKTFIGISYLWGGKSTKAIDCSGYTATIYFFNGIILQRDASQQIKYGETVTSEPEFSKLETGDLLFFGRKAKENKPEKVTHVGMYIGNDEFIHASGLVRISSLNPEKQNFDSTYVRMFLSAKRILNSVGKPGVEKIEDNKFYKYFFKKS